MGLYSKWQSIPVLLPGKSHGQRSLVGYSPWDHKESDTTEWLHFHFSLWCTGEGNGNPLQWSCLENPRDRGAWGAASSGVAQSRTLLKWLSSKSKKASLMAQLIKNLPANARGVRDVGLIPGFGSSPGEGNDNHSSEKMWAEKKSQKCKSLKRSL